MISPTSPSSEPQSIPSVATVPTPVDEGVDKDTLVKDAMQLAIERAKKRKQEGEAEEKRRLEAAERARKKAEALAAAQEEKKRAQVTPSTAKDDQTSKVRHHIVSYDLFLLCIKAIYVGS